MRKNILNILWVIFLSTLFYGCGKSGNGETSTSSGTGTTTDSIVTTTTTPVTSSMITASSGGVVQVASENTSLGKIKLSVPAGALAKDTLITIGAVNNPPPLPVGLNHLGAPVDFGPKGTLFSSPAMIEIPFTQLMLNQAGVLDESSLKLFVFDEMKNEWVEIKILYIDIVGKVVVAQLEHFSIYSLVGLSGTQPTDLGKPQMGDILFTLTKISVGKVSSNGWYPGHDGIYTGEKKWNGQGKASEDVVRCGKYNVVEALMGGVQYSYYKIPNTTQSCKTETLFSDNSVYMGAREPKKFTLTSEQRAKIVEFAESQVGKPYAMGPMIGNLFGLLNGSAVKGPNSFNCVGLVEKAYEYAQTNNMQEYFQGLITFDEGDILTPADQYRQTKPAGGVDEGPNIISASLTPSKGSATTQVLAQISVFHPDGLDHIESVKYETDGGYVNPNININDDGIGGDKVAGDGIYSAQSAAGSSTQNSNILGLKFIVTDKNGKSASVRLVYTYTSKEIAAKSTTENAYNSWNK